MSDLPVSRAERDYSARQRRPAPAIARVSESRAAGDYRWIRDEDEDLNRNAFRFLTGFTFYWGSR
jgi:hypothetical protein